MKKPNPTPHPTDPLSPSQPVQRTKKVAEWRWKDYIFCQPAAYHRQVGEARSRFHCRNPWMAIVNHLRILFLAAVAAFLVGGFLNQHESDNLSSDTLLTLLFLGYIWHLLRRNKNAPPPTAMPPETAEPTAPVPAATSQQQPSPAVQPTATAKIPESMRITPRAFRHASGRIVQHKQPWSIVAQGQPLGQYRHVPIPAWIRTSDNRHADYTGITPTPPPDGCVCLEVIDKEELILPPGLVYTIRS